MYRAEVEVGQFFYFRIQTLQVETAAVLCLDFVFLETVSNETILDESVLTKSYNLLLYVHLEGL